MRWIRSPWTAVFLVMILAACTVPGERCEKCGMRVDDSPGWTAGMTGEDGTEQRFCSPRCLFAFRAREQVAGKLWITEYYSRQQMAADDVLFVVGSDVIGPMGTALVPVHGREAAEQFAYDHGGESIVEATDITPELLRSLTTR